MTSADLLKMFKTPTTKEEFIEQIKADPLLIANMNLLAWVEAISKVLVVNNLCTEEELVKLQALSLNRLINAQADLRMEKANNNNE